MTSLERDVRKYFEKCYSDDPDILDEYDAQTLTFSFLVGMDPSSCTGMEVETEWTQDQIDEYDEVEGIVNRLKMEKYGHY